MLICSFCAQTISDSNIKKGDNCPKIGCPGEIIEIKDILGDIFTKLRRKGYEVRGISTGEMDKIGFYIAIYPIQCEELLPPLPKSIHAFIEKDVLVLEREIKSAKGSKRDNEIKKAEAEFSQYIDDLPHIGSLHFKCEFHGKSEADKLNNHLFLEDFCYTQIIYVKEGIYTVEGMRIINLDEARQEVDGLFSLYSKFYCDNVWY